MLKNQLLKPFKIFSAAIGEFLFQGVKTSLIFFFAVFLFLGHDSLAQVPIEWQFTAGGTDNDKGRKLLVTDGGIIIIGNSSSSFFKWSLLFKNFRRE